MTLSARNFVFKAGMVVSLLFLVMCIIITINTAPLLASMENDIPAFRRSAGIFQALFGRFLDERLLAVNACLLALAAYSFLSVLLIYHFFEKTQSPEILFVALFAFSFSPEMLRMLIPLGEIHEIPSLYSLMASRIILFSRHFGLFSLFAASLIAAGYETQFQRNVIIFITVTALVVALGVPVDTQRWDSGLNMLSGYAPMLRLIEGGTILITAISFFIASWSRSSRGFIFIGTGSVLALLGRNILLNADAWAALFPGLLLLAFGTWLISINLHKIYLWL